MAEDVRSALTALKAAGISERDVSVLCSDVPTLEGAYSNHVEGMLPNAASLLVAGIGPCAVSGPVAHMLVGTPAGKLVSGLTAAPDDLGRLIGIPDRARTLFTQQLSNGKGIVLVHYSSRKHEKAAQDVFERLGASDISRAGEAARSARVRQSRSESSA